jgi:hypothetical protein
MIQAGNDKEGLFGCQLTAPMAAAAEFGTQINDEQNGIARDGVFTNGVAESLLRESNVMTLRLVVAQTPASHMCTQRTMLVI